MKSFTEGENALEGSISPDLHKELQYHPRTAYACIIELTNEKNNTS